MVKRLGWIWVLWVCVAWVSTAVAQCPSTTTPSTTTSASTSFSPPLSGRYTHQDFSGAGSKRAGNFGTLGTAPPYQWAWNGFNRYWSVLPQWPPPIHEAFTSISAIPGVLEFSAYVDDRIGAVFQQQTVTQTITVGGVIYDLSPQFQGRGEFYALWWTPPYAYSLHTVGWILDVAGNPATQFIHDVTWDPPGHYFDNLFHPGVLQIRQTESWWDSVNGQVLTNRQVILCLDLGEACGIFDPAHGMAYYGRDYWSY